MTTIKIWGFSEINGERRHIRLVHFTGPKGEEINARLVYDYGKSGTYILADFILSVHRITHLVGPNTNS